MSIPCADGFVLSARAFTPRPETDLGITAVVTTATGAKASYYWRYAAFLAERGFRSVVADYRGVGRSAPAGGTRALRRMRTRWHEWGTLDIDAVFGWAQANGPGRRIVAVGHSFGGLGVCLAPRANEVERLLTVGAQHAHWRDYALQDPRALLRWHVVMPAIARVAGYLPGKRLGWLEDIPRGVAFDWARGRANFADTIGLGGAGVMERVANLDFEVLAAASTDDPFATEAATQRFLSYLHRAKVERRELEPAELGVTEIGHLGVFHERFREPLWGRSADWLAEHSGRHSRTTAAK
ncbi:alpha/beta hydrolase family protein [Leucobacter komagatae]|uniref:alpha/beta hydrolase family protein n=1 Tax=Leucobacter komagatae TaxID=55969 RepID=UPI001476F9F9|nr:alpha/beta fold hydrolase [Leucobacter komagatae]